MIQTLLRGAKVFKSTAQDWTLSLIYLVLNVFNGGHSARGLNVRRLRRGSNTGEPLQRIGYPFAIIKR
jgi:hypothetical protein